ncbi:hypothetical protein NS365_05690 [Aureimonas ureilytica]|uniref:Uncharacterized protein n=1 Tax=Aureimonas ureilytica TaxID=401562 RepID=A0A175RU06_9HYPH|nr:flippase [Aureimonas ureilytica]KTR06923.1 hypothetical protein NS365_05690 [Aureimonas ureilytica]
MPGLDFLRRKPSNSAAEAVPPAGGHARAGLIGNITALGFLQISAYVLPLAIAAYTTRVLGVADWGHVALTQMVLSFFCLVVSWGFSWSATRKIAAIGDDPHEVSRVAIATIAGQVILAGLMGALLLVLIETVPFFADAAPFYAWGLVVIAGTALFPNWLLQGLERMKAFSAIQIGGRILTLVLIILLVHAPDDAPLIIAIQGTVSLVAGFVSVWLLHRDGILIWSRPSARDIFEEIKEGSAIFLSTTAIGIYVNLTPVILGFLAGPVAVGQFALADRIRQAAQSVLQPVSTALFPRISRLVASDPRSAAPLLKISGIGLVVISTGITGALWVLAPQFVVLIGGQQFAAAAEVLRWLAFLPVVMSFSTFLGLQILLPNKRTKAFNTILVSGGILSLVIIAPLIKTFGPEGAAMTLLIVEGFVSLSMVIYVLKTGYFRGHWHTGLAAASA